MKSTTKIIVTGNNHFKIKVDHEGILCGVLERELRKVQGNIEFYLRSYWKVYHNIFSLNNFMMPKRELVHQTATDKLIYQYAEERDIPTKHIDIEKTIYGRLWRLIQNGELVKKCDRLIVIWRRQCRTLKHLISRARFYGLQVTVYDYETGQFN